MKAVFMTQIGNFEKRTPGRVALRECAVPEPGTEDVLIRVRCASICGSDINTLNGRLGDHRAEWESQLPLRIGHEFSGVIEEAGEKARGLGFTPGLRVSANYARACGACDECRSGRENFCEHRLRGMGAMAEYACYHMSQVYRLPDAADMLSAALTEPASIALNAIETAHVIPGKSAVVFGGGGIGQIVVQMARLAGASRIVLIEPSAERRALALACGADAAIDPQSCGDLADAVFSTVGKRGADCVIETSGASSAAVQALPLAAKGGDVAYIAMYDPAFALPLSLFDLYHSGRHISGMFTSAQLFPRTINLLDRLSLARLATLYPAEAYEAAFNDQRIGKSIKSVLQFSD